MDAENRLRCKFISEGKPTEQFMKDRQIERLARDLGLAIDKLNTFEPLAIVLHGGYGRDEGSWYEEEGEFKPYNDYDLVLIVQKEINCEKLDVIRVQLAEKIGIRWIDIDQINVKRLRKLKPTIKNYDLKYASKVISGDKLVLESIPEMKPKNLSLREGEILFFTRLWTFLGSLPDHGFHFQKLVGEASRFFRNQMAKAVLSVVDILLLRSASYHPSYAKRVQRVLHMFPGKEEFLGLAQWALDEKLSPKSPEMTVTEVRDMYFRVKEFFFQEMMFALEELYGRRIPDLFALEHAYRSSIMNRIRSLKSLVEGSRNSFKKNVNIDLAQAFIASAITENGNDGSYLSRGIDLLRTVHPVASRELDWEQARLCIARIRIKAQTYAV